ncbi:virion structural protein [Tenacibaculum phage PTm1]|uniref:Uncharacterized protein n=2 Tax=Shirahamavirus PTm1 TaxID=2846435 RepID=A0A5S9HXT1_9CAUD|nr:virion structural protein [Tenacibaculum phage PTm1]BBI90547.1 hypothetical protein [Tenacibaculum phage PTm1]BBI90855.1 hypothetical protein [Tenacibaculum phage PTm5]
MQKAIIIILFTLVTALGIGYVVMNISYGNQEQRLRNSIENKIEANQSHFSKMQNIIFGNAEVAKKYAEDFKKIYPDLIAGRYSKHQGKMMQWVQESNPNYSTKLLENVQVQITAQRESFHTTQTQLLDLKRVHDDLLTTFPGSFFLSDKEQINVPIIKNAGVEKVFETETEQPKSLF